jgi:hypothetical protein
LPGKNKGSLFHNLIREALQREAQQKWQTVTKFQQEPPNQHSADTELKEGETKRLTLPEYEKDFRFKMEKEVHTFKESLRSVAAVGG